MIENIENKLMPLLEEFNDKLDMISISNDVSIFSLGYSLNPDSDINIYLSADECAACSGISMGLERYLL